MATAGPAQHPVEPFQDLLLPALLTGILAIQAPSGFYELLYPTSAPYSWHIKAQQLTEHLTLLGVVILTVETLHSFLLDILVKIWFHAETEMIMFDPSSNTPINHPLTSLHISNSCFSITLRGSLPLNIYKMIKITVGCVFEKPLNNCYNNFSASN